MKRIFRRIYPVLRFLFLSLLAIILYETVFKPTLPYLRDFFLNVTSLGIQSVKDKTYLTVAKGFHESSSLDLNTTLPILLCIFVIFISVYLILKILRTKEETLELIREAEGVEEERESENDLNKELGSFSSKSKWLLRAGYLGIFFIVVALGIQVAESFRLRYINSAVTHYRQVLNICDPYLNDSDKKRIVSTFAQIRKKEHYIAVIKELEKIATEKRQYVPKFEAW